MGADRDSNSFRARRPLRIGRAPLRGDELVAERTGPGRFVVNGARAGRLFAPPPDGRPIGSRRRRRWLLSKWGHMPKTAGNQIWPDAKAPSRAAGPPFRAQGNMPAVSWRRFVFPAPRGRRSGLDFYQDGRRPLVCSGGPFAAAAAISWPGSARRGRPRRAWRLKQTIGRT